MKDCTHRLNSGYCPLADGSPVKEYCDSCKDYLEEEDGEETLE